MEESIEEEISRVKSEYFNFSDKPKKKYKKKVPSIVKTIRNFTPAPIDWGYQKVVSFSQFQKYMTCPHQWKLMYKDGHKVFEPNMHAVFGTSMHETLQHYLKIMYDQSIAAADRINIVEYFENQLRQQYLKTFKQHGKQHFSDPNEIDEFFSDGVKILEYFKKHKKKYFSKKGCHLVGVEVPLTLIPYKPYKNVIFNGYLDLVLFDEDLNKLIIIDIKTSINGWGDNQKKDPTKTMQLVLYKKYLSELFGVETDMINVEYLILKRKVWDHSEYHIPRIQQFKPASGRNKLNQTEKLFTKFIKEGFAENHEYEITPSPSNCRFCPFSDNKTLCPKGIKQ